MSSMTIGRNGIGNTPRTIPRNPAPNPTQQPQRCQHGHCTRDTFEQPRTPTQAPQSQAAQQSAEQQQGFLQMLQQLLPMLQQLLAQGGQQPAQPTQQS